MDNFRERLAHVTLFSTLLSTELRAINDRFREDTYLADTFIFHEGDLAARFWIVNTGEIKIVKVNPAGKSSVIEIISPGEVFGAATMLMHQQPASAQALTDATTLSLSRDEYKQLLAEYPSIAVEIIEALGERMHGMVRMRALTSSKVERRIAHILLKCAEKMGQATAEGMKLQISLTRQDLADLADTSLETAIRTMSHFRKQGLVKTLRGGYIVLLQPERLRDLAQSE